MNIYFKIGIVLIGVFILLALVTVILIFNDRTKLNDLSQKKEYLGNFYSGTFYSQPLLPLEDNKDEELNKIIHKHNKKIGLFYFSFLFLIAAIVFFNIGD